MRDRFPLHFIVFKQQLRLAVRDPLPPDAACRHRDLAHEGGEAHRQEDEGGDARSRPGRLRGALRGRQELARSRAGGRDSSEQCPLAVPGDTHELLIIHE